MSVWREEEREDEEEELGSSNTVAQTNRPVLRCSWPPTDGLSGAAEGGDPGHPEEGERGPEEAAGGGAGQADRRGA